MELTVIRYSSKEESTLGLLLINGTFAAYTLEDEYREVKVMGETRIPAGRYKVEFRKEGTHHEKYKVKFPDIHKGMLHITNVPDFKWILIHIGNTDEDTAGCLLLGDSSISNVNDEGRINNSTAAYKRVYPIIANTLELGEEVWITYLDNIPTENIDEEISKHAYVTVEQLNFRKSPGGQKLGVLFKNSDIEIMDQHDGWSRIFVEGWVSSAYID